MLWEYRGSGNCMQPGFTGQNTAIPQPPALRPGPHYFPARHPAMMPPSNAQFPLGQSDWPSAVATGADAAVAPAWDPAPGVAQWASHQHLGLPSVHPIGETLAPWWPSHPMPTALFALASHPVAHSHTRPATRQLSAIVGCTRMTAVLTSEAAEMVPELGCPMACSDVAWRPSDSSTIPTILKVGTAVTCSGSAFVPQFIAALHWTFVSFNLRRLHQHK